jgi:hypothetical protein
MNTFDTIECLECGKHFKQITATHLKKSHNMTMDEYMSKYNSPLVVSKSVSKKKSEKTKETKSKQTIIPWNKGKQISKEQRNKQSISMKEYYANNEHWNTNKKLSKETKNKISDSLKGHTYSTESVNKRNKTIQEKKKNGWKSPLLGEKLSDEHAKKSKEQLLINAKNKRIKYHNLIKIKAKENNLTILSHDYYTYHLKCNKCETTFNRTRQIFRQSTKNGINICPTCYPLEYCISKGETEMYEWIKTFYSGKVIRNDRTQLSGKEIDIYLPELNIGIEYCGIYWHSNLFKDKNHLLKKRELANEKNIKLYTIFDSEWEYKKDITKSRIKHIINKTNRVIYARKTNVIEISSKISKKFLNENHIQGKDISSIRYGAYENDELVAVMTFSKLRFSKHVDGEYELCRYCNLRDVSVVGIASKIFKRFIKDYSPKKIISYADKRWSYGEIYNTLNFKLTHDSPPSPWYTNDFKTLKHRTSFMRHKLDININESTEDKILEMGYYKIYDCGNMVWSYTLNEK